MILSEQLELLEKAYNKSMTPNWKKALSLADKTFLSDDGECITYFVQDGICFVNSATKAEHFKYSSKKILLGLAKAYDRIVFSSSRKDICDLASKLGLSYNDEYKFFSKGV